MGVAADELAAALGAAPDEPAPATGDSGSERESESDWGAEGDADAEAAAEWCRARRDRLLAALYGRLFTWLVTGVNARLRAGRDARTLPLSILDVYGLEALAHNALERLLVNYAAERLQACVTRATLRRQQDEYVREGLAWAPLRVPDHDLAADLLDAVSARPAGLPPPAALRPPPLQRAPVAGRRQRAGRAARLQRARAGRRRAAATPAAPPAPAPAGAAAAPLPVSVRARAQPADPRLTSTRAGWCTSAAPWCTARAAWWPRTATACVAGWRRRCPARRTRCWPRCSRTTRRTRRARRAARTRPQVSPPRTGSLA